MDNIVDIFPLRMNKVTQQYLEIKMMRVCILLVAVVVLCSAQQKTPEQLEAINKKCSKLVEEGKCLDLATGKTITSVSR